LSAAAIASPPVYDRARAVARYSETMRDLIQSFKYHERQESLALFTRWLARAGAELLTDAADLIVPVPLYRARLWWRRFNQSAMLARPARSRSTTRAPLLSAARLSWLPTM
jgi:predicted amidophosphoribosyltransferase